MTLGRRGPGVPVLDYPGAAPVGVAAAVVTAGLLLYYHVITISTTVAVWLGYVTGGIVGLVALAFIAAAVWTALERHPGDAEAPQ